LRFPELNNEGGSQVANPLANPLTFLFGSSISEAKELTTDIIKIRGGAILLTDKIMQIRNIASIEVVSLAASFPWIAPLLILIGLFSFRNGGIITIIALAVAGWGGFLIYKYYERRNARGLLLLLNSGLDSSTLITGVSFDFLKQIALTLYNIIDTGEEHNVDIYVDQKKITEVTIKEVSHSVISLGAVTGDIVNSVE
jgi:hypothetical protein